MCAFADTTRRATIVAMDFEAAARRDVEETLRTELDAIERGVARGRLALYFALTLFMTFLCSALLLGIVSMGPTPTAGTRVRLVMPFVMFGLGLLYAFGVWRQVSRKGGRPAFTAVVAFADALVVVVIVITLRMVMPAEGAEPLAARFDIYGLAPILILVVFLGCLRIDRRLRLPLAVFTIALYLVAIRIDLGRFEVPQLLAAMLIGVGAGLGSKTSDRFATTLNRHSRLSVLRSYLPQSFADRVSSDSIDLRSAFEPQAIEVTLLVADLRGFTATSESLAPADVVAMLGDYHEAMLEAVEAHGGVVDKFLGDGMLVVFGLRSHDAPPPADAGAGPAVRCAAAMQERLARLNASRAAAGKPALAMGIGIHTGPVIAGTIGAGRRREFTVIGDAVNTASRLEGLTRSADAPVLVSAATAARLAGDPRARLRELAPMAVKGKAEPLRIFALAPDGVAEA